MTIRKECAERTRAMQLVCMGASDAYRASYGMQKFVKSFTTTVGSRQIMQDEKDCPSCRAEKFEG